MDNLTQKQKEAITRSEDRSKRSAKEQLALLDQRLGSNVGARKERNRLAKEGSKSA
tara:strand:- start:3783 stop:3950 length:168 start_codon:yes stop_codon:yes gene_type:complete